MSSKLSLTEKSKKYNYEVWENASTKNFISPEANYNFNKHTGVMYSWGKTYNEDPKEFPAPNLLDVECSTICNHGCKFCFEGETPISTPSGTKDIKDIKVGDIVYSYDFEKNSIVENKVEQTFTREYSDVFIIIELEDDSHLKMTENHPIYVKDYGWIEAKGLIEDMEVFIKERTQIKPLRIKSISYSKETKTVYNFGCLPNNNYFANGILVHNCYKSNLPEGHNMSLEEFKHIVDILPKSVTQIAFGSGYYGTENSAIFDMMDYARDHGIIPNITVGYVDDETASKFASRVGAISVSSYESKGKKSLILRRKKS